MFNRDAHEANRLAWNEATKAHNSHKKSQAEFLRNGGSTLFPEEIRLLGDVRGKRLLHLQANSGQDTLSIASQLGAIVTGVDISDEAIAFARDLARDSGIGATFERADVYDWLSANKDAFDVVFSSYGAIPWLSDLRLWARGIASSLGPGGRFILVEFHPYLQTLDDDGERVVGDYSGGMQSFDEGIGDYVAWAGKALAPSGYLDGVVDFRNPHPGYEFNNGLADVIGSLLGAGLSLDHFEEYSFANGFPAFRGTVEIAPGRFAPAEGKPRIPMMYSVVARKLA